MPGKAIIFSAPSGVSNLKAVIVAIINHLLNLIHLDQITPVLSIQAALARMGDGCAVLPVKGRIRHAGLPLDLFGFKRLDMGRKRFELAPLRRL